jgi:hypothetical protein
MRRITLGQEWRCRLSGSREKGMEDFFHDFVFTSSWMYERT